MGFSRQKYWSGLPFPSPGDLPNPGIKTGSPALQADALPSEAPGKPQCNVYVYQITLLSTTHILQFYVNYASIKLKLKKGKTKETEPHIPLGVDRVQQYDPVVHILSLFIDWLVCKHWMACAIESAVFLCQASLVAPLVKNPPEVWETWVRSWVGKIPWRRERLPTPVFLGFPGGSAGKESTCSAGDLGSILGWEDPLEEGKATHSSILAWRIPWTV